MTSRRLELALERLQPSDWGRFERISSAFLASEFDNLRTTASPSGDEGRDSELFSPHGEATVVMQYSVAKDWQAKINATVRRLKKTMPNVLLLIYVSNQVIGADADELKKTLRTKHGLGLDVRDRNWFVEREFSNVARERAADELATAIVNPLLASAGVGPHVQAEFSTPEAVAALTFLGLQWQDDVREKGLTRLAFEALVRAVLVNTSAENRMPKKALFAAVEALLPEHPANQVHALVESSLKRLLKQTIKHWPKEDEYCLAHEELVRLNKFRIESELSEANLRTAVEIIARSQLAGIKVVKFEDSEVLTFAAAVRTATDAVLFEKSQAFAMAVHAGSLAELANSDFSTVVIRTLATAGLHKTAGVDWSDILKHSIKILLTSADPSVRAYLRSLSDRYTLMAFLKQTPDVQGAVEKMFSHGWLWLDASVVLPLIADTLAVSDGEKGRFTEMIDAARDAGLKLFLTTGVIEEIERHMNRALVCARMTIGQWEGSIPYLLERYIESGRSSSSFASWLENFRGDSRPLDDLSEYLRGEFGIVERSLEAERNSAPSELRHALEQIWYERYERRRERYGSSLDDAAITRLVNHDVECYSGVVYLRSKEEKSGFGYTAWWLTVDRQAFDLKDKLRSLMTDAPPQSPVMSADFLVNYLAFGPMRRKVSKDKEAHLPLLLAFSNTSQLTGELIAEAESLRNKLKDLPERLIRRQVRDHLDRARSHMGPIANMGMKNS